MCNDISYVIINAEIYLANFISFRFLARAPTLVVSSVFNKLVLVGAINAIK